MVAEIITVATEVVNANVSNNVAPYITEGLRDIGFDVFYQSSVDNDDSRVKKLFNVAASRSDLIALVTGYGVKADNIMAAYGLVKSKKSVGDAVIYEKNNLKVITFPLLCEDVQSLWNDYSSLINGMNGIFYYSATIKTTGLETGELLDRLSEIERIQLNPSVSIIQGMDYGIVKVTGYSKDFEEAKSSVKSVVKDIKDCIKGHIFTTDRNEYIENSVIRLLKKYDLKISTAESVTGGLVVSRLVNVPGASEVFTHGFVTYSNKAKRKVLGVDRESLKKYSAVSKEVAKEMAKGAIFTADADVSVAVTGYSGPDDTPEEPKGLVYIAVSVNDKVIVEKYNFSGSRNIIRNKAANRALELVRESIIAAYGK